MRIRRTGVVGIMLWWEDNTESLKAWVRPALLLSEEVADRIRVAICVFSSLPSGVEFEAPRRLPRDRA